MSLRLLAVVLLMSLLSSGCTEVEWKQLFGEKERPAQPEPAPRLISRTQASVATVGELVTLDGLRLLQVRGFGLVMDLPETGGGDAPDPVRQYIMKEIRRRETTPSSKISPTDLLKGRDIAIVEVSGLVPAAAEKGEVFDVVVRALGTQTTSLASGRLVICELKPYAETIDGILGAKTVATASGPIFISPVGLEKDVPTKIDLRRGLVLGGGRNTNPRNVRLVLNDPSPSIASRIVDRLNGSYGRVAPVAKGRDTGTVDLTIPQDFRDKKRVFLERIMFTTLNASPSALEKRAKDLVAEAEHPDAEFESIGCAWDAIGRVILPIIRELYRHQLAGASYIAGRTGLRMGDSGGLEIVAQHALDRESPFRQQAIEELGYATTMHGAGECLRKLLDDPDTITRIRAYQSLRRHGHSAIETKVLCDDNLVLDVLDCNGPYLIYVQRAMSPRIAVFGKAMSCRTPAIYPADRRDDRYLFTQISAQDGDNKLTVFYKNKHNGKVSPPLAAPLGAADLIRYLGDRPVKNEQGEPTGLAVPYDEIVDILYVFCKSGTVPAEFHAEDLTGRETSQEPSQERKESEY